MSCKLKNHNVIFIKCRLKLLKNMKKRTFLVKTTKLLCRHISRILSTIKQTPVFIIHLNGCLPVFCNCYFSHEILLLISFSLIFSLVFLPIFINDVYPVFFWKKVSYFPLDARRNHSLILFSKFIKHPPNKLSVWWVTVWPKWKDK